MLPQTKAMLEAFYAPFLRKLAAMLGDEKVGRALRAAVPFFGPEDQAQRMRFKSVFF